MKMRPAVTNPAKLLVLQAALALFVCSVQAQEQQQAPVAVPPGTAATRPCRANPVLAYTPSKKNAKKPKRPPPAEPAPTCIEVRGDSFGIQEFLQNLARRESWRLGENHASEDMWSFVRYFNPSELDTYADTKVLLEPVKFSSGKAAATVRTTDIGEDFVRVQISLRIQGEGKSADPNWTQPATVWPLNSKGVFEQELVTALQTRYKALD
jgi:hypothetical protein